jgi:hypothetical protein
MDATTATTLVTANKGTDVEIVLVDGSSVYGTAFSVNSKGVNVKDDEGKTRSVSLARIDHIDVLDENDTFGADDDADDEAAAELADTDELTGDEDFGYDGDEADDLEANDDIEDELHDDMTTAELAELMGTTPKALRVSLRALGMGVGKGRRYSLHATAYNLVKAHVDANN